MRVHRPMSTCGCQPLGRTTRVLFSYSEYRYPVRSSVRSFSLSRTFVRTKFSPTCVLLVGTYLYVRMNESGRIDSAKERVRKRGRDGGKIGQRRATRGDNPISVPASLNPDKFRITFDSQANVRWNDSGISPWASSTIFRRYNGGNDSLTNFHSTWRVINDVRWLNATSDAVAVENNGGESATFLENDNEKHSEVFQADFETLNVF